eukprot:4233592-Ditylum_brightwellii.AAC.1
MGVDGVFLRWYCVVGWEECWATGEGVIGGGMAIGGSHCGVVGGWALSTLISSLAASHMGSLL